MKYYKSSINIENNFQKISTNELFTVISLWDTTEHKNIILCNQQNERKETSVFLFDKYFKKHKVKHKYILTDNKDEILYHIKLKYGEDVINYIMNYLEVLNNIKEKERGEDNNVDYYYMDQRKDWIFYYELNHNRVYLSDMFCNILEKKCKLKEKKIAKLLPLIFYIKFGWNYVKLDDDYWETQIEKKNRKTKNCDFYIEDGYVGDTGLGI